MVVLRGKRVLLRPGRPEDADRLYQIRNEPEVVQWWGRADLEEEISEEFIQADDGFVIEADGEVVGAIQYHEENGTTRGGGKDRVATHGRGGLSPTDLSPPPKSILPQTCD